MNEYVSMQLSQLQLLAIEKKALDLWKYQGIKFFLLKIRNR